MKPFNLKEALEGERVVNREGNPVTQIHEFDSPNDVYTILAVGISGIEAYRESDLFMASKKKEGWVNIYKGTYMNGDHSRGRQVFSTKSIAEEVGKIARFDEYVASVHVEWEE